MFTDITDAGIPPGPLGIPRPLYQARSRNGKIHLTQNCRPRLLNAQPRALVDVTDGEVCTECRHSLTAPEFHTLRHATTLLTAAADADRLSVCDESCTELDEVGATAWWNSLASSRGDIVYWETSEVEDHVAPLYAWARKNVVDLIDTALAHLSGHLPWASRTDWAERLVVAETALGAPENLLSERIVPDPSELRVLLSGLYGTLDPQQAGRWDVSENSDSDALPARVRNYAVRAYRNGGDPVRVAQDALTYGRALVADLAQARPLGDWSERAGVELVGFTARIGAALAEAEQDAGGPVHAVTVVTWIEDDAPLLYAHVAARLADGSYLTRASRSVAARLVDHWPENFDWGPVDDVDVETLVAAAKISAVSDVDPGSALAGLRAARM